MTQETPDPDPGPTAQGPDDLLARIRTNVSLARQYLVSESGTLPDLVPTYPHSNLLGAVFSDQSYRWLYAAREQMIKASNVESTFPSHLLIGCAYWYAPSLKGVFNYGYDQNNPPAVMVVYLRTPGGHLYCVRLDPANLFAF